MKFSELIKQINDFSSRYDLPEIFICGGIPRDKVIGLDKAKINDLDLTTGDSSIKVYSLLIKDLLKEKYSIKFRTMEDGHSSIFLGNLKIDFSSNFKVPNINNVLKAKGLNNPKPIEEEMWSRDFTCNSLLLKLDLKSLIDPTEMGFKDINDKLLRTCLTPDLTLKFNPNRIPRIIYLSSKLNFRVDDNIIDWVSKNQEFITQCDQEYITKKINKALMYNKQNTISLLDAMNLWDYIPITPQIDNEYRLHLARRNVKK